MTVRVRFEDFDEEVDVEPGAELMDVSDELPNAEVPYGCRSASCGTCRIQILEGMELLSPIDEDEQEVLTTFGDGPDVRLCCQARVEKDGERIVLKVCDPQ